MTARSSHLPTPTQELLLKAALLDDERALAAWERWKLLSDLTDTDQDSARLFPLLFRKLLSLGVDDPGLRVLKSAYRHQWLVNQVRIAGGARALAALSRAGVPTMVLKGAALAGRYYRDLATRPMYDVDILVRPHDARAAVKALLASGWTQFMPAQLEVLLDVTHGTLLREQPTVGVDLHWYSMWAPAVENDFWSAAEVCHVGGVPTLAQCPADQLLHVCVHGIWTDGRPIRWVADAVTVLRVAPDLDWDRVLAGARRRQATLPLRTALQYLEDRFEVSVPSAVLRQAGGSRAGGFELACHRAWQAPPPSRRRMAWLALERYRRLRRLPQGPTRERNLWRYLSHWVTVTLVLDRDARPARALLRRTLRRRR